MDVAAFDIDIAVIRIGVFPVPLMAGDLDCHVWVWCPVEVVNQPERWDRHDHQNHHWAYRPEDFQHGVMGGLARNRVALFAIAKANPGQQRGHEQRDHRDHDQHQIMKLDDLLLHRAERGLHIHFPGARGLRQRRVRSQPQQQTVEAEKPHREASLRRLHRLNTPLHPQPPRHHAVHQDFDATAYRSLALRSRAGRSRAADGNHWLIARTWKWVPDYCDYGRIWPLKISHRGL